MTDLLPHREGQLDHYNYPHSGGPDSRREGNWYSPAAVARMIKEARREEREASKPSKPQWISSEERRPSHGQIVLMKLVATGPVVLARFNSASIVYSVQEMNVPYPIDAEIWWAEVPE